MQTAQNQIGITENPPGSNNVVFNTDFYGQEVSGDAYSWCCVFVWWLFNKSGNGAAFYDGEKVSRCGLVYNWAQNNGLFINSSEAKYGDIVLFGDNEHIEVVVSNNGDGTFTTIGGNTSGDGAGSQSNVLDFCVDLIKDKKQGFTGKGMYIFPKEDGCFIEWLISEENQENCRVLKTGDFSKCEKPFLRKVIDGLIDILRHLEIPDEIIKMQQDIMEQKTMVYISYEAYKMWNRLHRSMYSIANFMEVAPSFMPYEDEKEYWIKFSEDLDSFLNKKEAEYMEQERAFRSEILADAPRLTKEEMEFSMRSYDIMRECGICGATWQIRHDLPVLIL